MAFIEKIMENVSVRDLNYMMIARALGVSFEGWISISTVT